MTTTTMIDSEKLSALQARVADMERKRFQCPESVNEVDESMRRARKHVEAVPSCASSAIFMFVPEPYYTWELSQRAATLGAPSVDYLCKSLLMDNKKVAADAPHDPTNPKFVLLIVQYAASVDNAKLINCIRALRPVKERLDVNQFDFRVASEQDNSVLTGYEHNSVTPFGLLQPKKICMLLSAATASLPFFWMGGGHVHLKLGMATSDFCKALKPLVGDISQPR